MTISLYQKQIADRMLKGGCEQGLGHLLTLQAPSGFRHHRGARSASIFLSNSCDARIPASREGHWYHWSCCLQAQRLREHHVRAAWWRHPADVPPTPAEAPHEPPADPYRPRCFIPLEVPGAPVSVVGFGVLARALTLTLMQA